jgi:hypothetical protein
MALCGYTVLTAMGNAELRMARLIASTLVLASTAWASSALRPSDENTVREIAPRLEAVWSQHDLKALASLLAEDCAFVSTALAQVHLNLSGETISRGAAGPPLSGLMSLVGARRLAPWLSASAYSTNLLANPPPR